LYSESLKGQDEGIELWKQLEADLKKIGDQHSKDVLGYVTASQASIIFKQDSIALQDPRIFFNFNTRILTIPLSDIEIC
jgi:hypothetical protein